jgi:hypothetical protein
VAKRLERLLVVSSGCESRSALGVDNRQRDSYRREKVRDLIVVGGHDLSSAVYGKNDNCRINDVARPRASEQSDRYARSRAQAPRTTFTQTFWE